MSADGDLREAMIEMLFKGIPADGENIICFDREHAGYITEAVINLLSRWDTGSEPA